MPKFYIELWTKNCYEFEVEATSKTEAKTIAKSEWVDYIGDGEEYDDMTIIEIGEE